jgi:hypothetical protein
MAEVVVYIDVNMESTVLFVETAGRSSVSDRYWDDFFLELYCVPGFNIKKSEAKGKV